MNMLLKWGRRLTAWAPTLSSYWRLLDYSPPSLLDGLLDELSDCLHIELKPTGDVLLISLPLILAVTPESESLQCVESHFLQQNDLGWRIDGRRSQSQTEHELQANSRYVCQCYVRLYWKKLFFFRMSALFICLILSALVSRQHQGLFFVLIKYNPPSRTQCLM